MRRTNLNELSSRLLNYVVEKRGLSMTEVATITGVDKSFVSRVKSAEREFSIDHLEAIADHFGVELGVLLIDSAPPLKEPNNPHHVKLREMCHDFMRKADALTARIKEKERQEKQKSNAA